MDTLLHLLSLVGSLGLFLYGMKIMSEGLEKFAGGRLRTILAMMTQNRLAGVFTGIFITALIQSSSATTVMVVSFVDSGLMNLTQAIGVIMGANVGTTITAWIISAIGFKVNIVAFTIPLLAVGLPLIFSSDNNRKNIGEFVFGFSFLFMGLNYLQTSAEALDINTVVANLLTHISGDNIFSMLLFIIVGAVVTMLVQASAATMAITLMLFSMHIEGFGFHQAAALAMGQNIGTTITAFLASLTGNTQARRAALAHMFFNVFGVVVVLVMFYPFCNGIVWIVRSILHAGANELFMLSAFHTAFNVFNTLLLIWFVPQIERFVCMVLPERESDKQERGLHFISGGLLSTAELSILEAKKEIGVFTDRLMKMIDMVGGLITTEKGKEFGEIYAKIDKYERITDNMEVEIANYLARVSEGRLSNESKAEITRMLRIVSELESISDSMFHLGRTLDRKRELSDESFTEKQLSNVQSMLALTRKALKAMKESLSKADARAIDFPY
ncbi:MAG: Na/Pi cotransporter family protein, partial [Prevotella sp.]|nr:Na/Pi cotransporter family protein [Prevotella sp.]